MAATLSRIERQFGSFSAEELSYISNQSLNIRNAAETFRTMLDNAPGERLEAAPTIRGFSPTESASSRWTYETITGWEADDGREGERFVRITSDYALTPEELMDALADAVGDMMNRYEQSFGGPIDPEAATFDLVEILGIYKSF